MRFSSLAPAGTRPYLAIVLVFACSPGLHAQTSSNKNKPVVRMDFRRSGAPLSSIRLAELGFIEDSTLALLFYETEKAVPKSTLPPSRLRMVTIDLKTSQLKVTRDFGIQPTVTARLFVNANNQLLAAIEKELILFSPELDQLKKRIFATPVSLTHVPPDRTTILVPVRFDGSKTHYELIDAGTLETTAEWTEDGHFVWSYTSAFLADIDLSRASGAFFIRKQGEDWWPVPIPVNPQCLSYPEFVAEKLAIQDDCHGSIFWVDPESRSWSKTSFSKEHRSLMHFLPTRDGKRFAATMVYWKFLWVPFEGHGRFTWTDGVQVYDVSTRQPVFTKKLDVSWLLGRVFEGGVALSADGTRLAILDRGILEVYELPPPLTK